MNAPTIFDKNTLKYFTAEIFKRIGNMEGVDIRSGGGTFDDKEFILKIKFTLDNPNLVSRNQEAYDRIQGYTDLPPWGFTFKDRHGEELTMVDYKPGSPKYKIIAMNNAGKKYKFTIKNIKQYLGI